MSYTKRNERVTYRVSDRAGTMTGLQAVAAFLILLIRQAAAQCTLDNGTRIDPAQAGTEVWEDLIWAQSIALAGIYLFTGESILNPYNC